MYSAKIEIKCDEDLSKAYLSALEPEQNFKTERAKYFLNKEKGRVIVKIEAQDATALRAIINTISGLISIVDKNWRKVKNG